MNKDGEYKLKKVIKMVDNKFEVKWKRYLNLKNTLKLLINLIWYKRKLKEYLKVD